MWPAVPAAKVDLVAERIRTGFATTHYILTNSPRGLAQLEVPKAQPCKVQYLLWTPSPSSAAGL